MGLLKKENLKYKYSWQAIGGDDPKVTGKPDNTLLNRSEGYEIIYFINKLAEIWEFKNKVSGIKIEKMLKEDVPSSIRSQADIKKWIYTNWDK